LLKPGVIALKEHIVEAFRQRDVRFRNCTGTNTVACIFCGKALYISHEPDEVRGTAPHSRVVHRTAMFRELEGGKEHRTCGASVEMMMGAPWGRSCAAQTNGNFDDNDDDDVVHLEDLDDDVLL
jgi:hypothetical protein